MKKMLCIIFLTALALPFRVSAQEVTAQLVKEWERAKKFTQDYLDAMPEDGYALKPTKEYMRIEIRKECNEVDIEPGC